METAVVEGGGGRVEPGMEGGRREEVGVSFSGKMGDVRDGSSAVDGAFKDQRLGS